MNIRYFYTVIKLLYISLACWLCFFVFPALGQTPLPLVDLTQLKYGLKDSLTNRVLLPAKYDYIAHYHNHYAIVKDAENYGVIDQNGEEIIPVHYQKIQWLPEGGYRIQKNDLFGLWDTELEEVLPAVFHDLNVTGSYIIVNNGSFDGLIDWQGNILLPFIFDEIRFESNVYGSPQINNQRIRVVQKNHVGIRDINNQVIIPFSQGFKEIDFWSDTIWYLENEYGKKGLMNENMDTLIPFGKYEELQKIQANRIAARKEDKYGYLDQSLNVVIPFMYDKALSFYGDIATCKWDGHWGVINQNNDPIIPFEYDAPISFHNNCAKIYRKDLSKWALVNAAGQLLTKFVYDEIIFERTAILVRQGNLWGLTNEKGEIMIPIQYHEIMLKRGFIVVVLDHQQGLFNQNGQEILRPEFEFIYPTRNDPYIMVRKAGKYGYVNLKGEMMIPLQYDNARNFKWGRATVLRQNKSFEIKRNGDLF